MTEATEIQPGVHPARVVVGDCADTTQVRLVILNEIPVKLIRDKLLGGLHPVGVEHGSASDEERGQVDDDFSIDS